MKSRSLVVLLLVVVALASLAFAYRREGGGALIGWLSSIHGAPVRH